MLRTAAFVFALGSFAAAQSQLDWLSSYNWPSNDSDFGRFCAVDASGATYVVGQVYVQQIGVPPPPPTADIGVTKFDVNGVRAWSTQVDPLGGQDFAYDIQVSPSGDIYVVGYASSTGAGIPALIKLDSAGVVQWTRTYSQPGFARTVAFDSLGQPIVVGHAYDPVSDNDVLVAKYSTSGALLWDVRMDGGAQAPDVGYGVLTLPNDELLVACGLAVSGDPDFGVLRLSSTGGVLWSRTIDGGVHGADAATHLALSGSIVVAGGYRAAATEDWMVAQLALSNGGVMDVSFHSGPGASSERVRSLAVDANGVAWFVGSHSSASSGIDFGVERHAPGGGLLSSTTWNNSAVNGDDSPFKLLLGSAGQAWVVGYSNQALGSPVSSDAQIVQFDASGAFNWAAHYSTPGAADDRAWDAELGPNDRLLLSGYTNGGGSGGYDFLALSVDVGDSPHAYCTPKLNSLGCLPTMSFSGMPSVAASTGFVVSCSNVRNQKSGLIFYSTLGAAAAPFQGGVFCVQAPTRRTPIALSNGSASPADDCSGSFALDMNAYAASGVDPALSSVGSKVYSQTWSRDPGAPFNTSLSNALAYTLLP